MQQVHSGARPQSLALALPSVCYMLNDQVGTVAAGTWFGEWAGSASVHEPMEAWQDKNKTLDPGDGERVTVNSCFRHSSPTSRRLGTTNRQDLGDEQRRGGFKASDWRMLAACLALEVTAQGLQCPGPRYNNSISSSHPFPFSLAWRYLADEHSLSHTREFY